MRVFSKYFQPHLVNQLRYGIQHEKRWNDQIKLGDIQLSSRIVMAAMTRMRCDPKDGVPTDLVKKYYEQRSGAAFILTEAISWSLRGHGFPGAGNLYTKEQAEGWKKVVGGVHEKGGKIFAQLCHCGRATNTKINGGLEVWGPSAITIKHKMISGDSYGSPKQMTVSDIKQTQDQFRKSLELSKQVGFDGIALHGANGYLIDQFLRSQSNKRTDDYGGSPQKRSRYTLQLIDIALQFYKPHQIGIKVSPVSQYQDMYDQNPVQTYSYLLQQLSKRNIGFVQARQSTEYGAGKRGAGSKVYFQKTPPQQMDVVAKILKPHFNGIFIANDSMTHERGLEFLKNGWADMISFARLYISNPDLAERLISNKPVQTKFDFKNLFSPFNPKGYTDYLYYDDWVKQQPAK